MKLRDTRLYKYIDRLSLEIVQIPLAARLVRFFSRQDVRVIRRRVEARLRASGRLANKVIGGPFTGMTFSNGWSSCQFEKLIGCYECDLHPTILKLAGNSIWTDIVNIGSHEGYYAVGLAMKLPGVKVTTYETDDVLRSMSREMARINGVDTRHRAEARCTPEGLASLRVGAYPLILIDIEGEEIDIVNPGTVPWLGRSTLLVELHDCFRPGIRPTLLERLAPTHVCQIIRQTGVDFSQYPILQGLTFDEIHAMIGEDRMVPQEWLLALPRSLGNDVQLI